MFSPRSGTSRTLGRRAYQGAVARRRPSCGRRGRRAPTDHHYRPRDTTARSANDTGSRTERERLASCMSTRAAGVKRMWRRKAGQSFPTHREATHTLAHSADAPRGAGTAVSDLLACLGLKLTRGTRVVFKAKIGVVLPFLFDV